MSIEVVKQKEKKLLLILERYGIADEKQRHLCLQDFMRELISR